jgi:hypothetical protein
LGTALLLGCAQDTLQKRQYFCNQRYY